MANHMGWDFWCNSVGHLEGRSGAVGSELQAELLTVTTLRMIVAQTPPQICCAYLDYLDYLSDAEAILKN